MFLTCHFGSCLVPGGVRLADVGQQGQETRPFDGPFGLSLVVGAVSASLSREDLAVLGGQFAENADVLVIDVVDLVAAEAALCLFAEA